MRVPEISLGYGLLAQNKHDLCRYYKYTERHKQTQYLPAYTVSFMVVPSVRAWEFRVEICSLAMCVVEQSPRQAFHLFTLFREEQQLQRRYFCSILDHKGYKP